MRTTALACCQDGDAEACLRLGGALRFGRLSVRASRVGTVAPSRRVRRAAADRLELALEMLQDPAFDAVVTGVSPFDELPDVMAGMASGKLPARCHPIAYP